MGKIEYKEFAGGKYYDPSIWLFAGIFMCTCLIVSALACMVMSSEDVDEEEEQELGTNRAKRDLEVRVGETKIGAKFKEILPFVPVKSKANGHITIPIDEEFNSYDALITPEYHQCAKLANQREDRAPYAVTATPHSSPSKGHVWRDTEIVQLSDEIFV